jgi:ABC-2 type transport system ATP-binding protein
MTQTAVLCVEVRKQYGSKRALDGLTLSIPHGRVVGILGPNGSGKSTLFRILTGLTLPDQGQVQVLGKPPGWQTNRDIAYLPDRARWYPDHSVRQAFTWAENFLPGFDIGTAEQLAEFMKVDLEARVRDMSRGQEARVMLILCIARRVPLIILDEPFSGIDAISRARIIDGLIDHISDGEHTVLISTHELYEAEALFDHAVFLDEGRVVLSGDADELRRQYGSMHTVMQTLYP